LHADPAAFNGAVKAGGSAQAEIDSIGEDKIAAFGGSSGSHAIRTPRKPYDSTR
jgi:hypothetical protein